MKKRDREWIATPSLLVVSIVVLGYFILSVLGPLLKVEPVRFERFTDDPHWTLSTKGYDNRVAREGAIELVNGRPMYEKTTARFVNYNLIPQSLLYFIPHAYLSEHTSLVITITLIIFLNFSGIITLSRSISCQLPVYYSFILLVFFCLSAPGLKLLETANCSGMGSGMILLGLGMLFAGQRFKAVLFIALATCFKQIFLPFVFLFFALPKWRRSFVTFLAIHVFVLATICLANGSYEVISNYIFRLPRFVGDLSDTHGVSISIPALFAGLATLLKKFDWIRPLMSLWMSLAVFVMLLAIGIVRWWDLPPRLKIDGELEMALLASYCVYTSLLWQSTTQPYNLLHLSALLPLLDFVFSRCRSMYDRNLIYFQSILLGLIFFVPEISGRGIYPRSAIYVLAFVGFLLMTPVRAGFLMSRTSVFRNKLAVSGVNP